VAEIILYLRDFEYGTKISEKLSVMEKSIIFAESKIQVEQFLDEKTRVIIVDLDDKEINAPEMIAYITYKHPEVKTIGYMKKVYNQSHGDLKALGCKIILPKSSFIKNLLSVIENI
jgi:DNA-binding NarL/FixJ family response regulator